MRKGWTLFSLFASVLLSAQVNNFSIIDGNLVWQNVFDTNLSQEGMEKLLIDSGRFSDITNTGDRITFFCPRTRVDYEKTGYRWGNTPTYIPAHDITFFCTFQFKDGRYRATVERMVMIENRTDRLYTDGHSSPLDRFATKDGEFRDLFIRKASDIYNKFLILLLDMRETVALSGEW